MSPPRPWCLVIYNERDVLDLSVAALERRADNVRYATNLADARQKLHDYRHDSCLFIVVGSSTPASAEHAYSSDQRRDDTVAFIREVREAEPYLPFIVLSSVPDGSLNVSLQPFSLLTVVRVDQNWRACLVDEATHFLTAPLLKHRQTARLEVEIVLQEPDFARWYLERRDTQPFEDSGDLHFDKEDFNEILKLSRLIEADSQLKGRWLHTLDDLASKLETLLFQSAAGSKRFRSTFSAQRNSMKGLEQARIRFAVSQETHAAFLEALKEASDRDPWMVQAPVVRKYSSAGNRYPLFKDAASRDNPIDCLIIRAHREGGELSLGSQGPVPLPTLLHIEAEANAIEEILNKAKSEGKGIGVVEQLSLTDEGSESPHATVIKKLKERHWHLVHFAGHAIQDGASAGLVLRVEPTASVLRFDDFSKLLFGARFLFLSCCRSGETSLIKEAADQSVPAILGYRWRVNDKRAATFAQTFYSQLFNLSNPRYKYLEYAFRDARKTLYDEDREDPTWASPMLVLQLKHAA